MKISGEMLWKYCLCLVLVSAYAAKKGRAPKSISGLDLLQNRLITTNRHHVENLTANKGHKFSDHNSGEINQLKLNKVLKKRTKSLTVEFVGYSEKKSLTTLFGIYFKHKPLPLFEISLDILRRKVILRYQGKVSFQRVTLTFGKELETWNVLSATVNKTHFTVTVGCTVEKSIRLKQKPSKIPKKAVGVLASDKLGKNKFTGQLFEARLYPYAMKKKSLLCSKPVHLQHEDGYVRDASANGDRILLLEQQITQLNNMVDMLKLQNTNLTDRVAELENCDCDTDCQWEGQMFDEGETWTKDKCTVCICKNGKADCLRRTDIPSCNMPCVSNPCMNQGQCVSVDEPSFPTDFQCLCQPPYDGQYCEYKENPCVWPRESGICDQNIPRFYYDMEIQQCLPFNYTGCGGNVNNYETLNECQAVAVKGACCFRQYSLKVEDIVNSTQNETFGCKEISLSECQSTHRQVIGNTKLEVIAFYPGVTCKEADCGKSHSVCMIDGRKYEVGEKANLGCQECTCESSGQFVCSCSQKAVRKEIRDMTAAELLQFQAAIQQLRLVGPGNPWEEFRDIYMRHTMHSNGGPYFLPWHRLFLRKLEQKLQEIDCSITLPYYDFTTDVGNFSQSILWQPNYFGGNGIDGCVIDHPFGLPNSWRPCISRSFNEDVKLPSLIELSVALASEDYTEMSMCLEAYVSYIHTYIGGDMATRAASYDPVFYTIHAYIDMLYWWWQQKGRNKFTYPSAFQNIPMIPFNVPPVAIIDLEADLCVTYLAPGQGKPCNKTTTSTGGRGPSRGDVTPQGANNFVGGFNDLGYDTNGFDRRGFNEDGYKINGFNRDGYNEKGFDMYGYDRYGYDKDGYSPYGYDIEGWDRNNNQDLTGRYNAYGLDINCLDRQGLTTTRYDQYGFDMLGYDMERCNYFYDGPFATIQSQKIWQILLVQPKAFLMTLARTCPGLEPLPMNWLQQYWITDIKDVSNMIPVSPVSNSDQLNSARFCFDIDDFVTPCGCDLQIAVCEENPCQTNECPSYPEASCRVNVCGVCKPQWLLNGKEVDCYEERDFCQPNPCDNGGTCVASIWPKEPQLTTCLCPPGYDGHHCQYTSLDVCDLPVSSGNCSYQQTRWYFEPQSQSCKSFIYSGCRGNANNFMDQESCETRCKIGACCYRTLSNSNILVGYNKQGYDMYGYNVQGTNRRGDVRIDDKGWGKNRYDWQGYDRNGYDRSGFDRLGLDKERYNKDGFNLTGYSRGGEYDGIIDYTSEGYDPEGYNRAGYTCYGANRDGLNVYGINTEYVYKCRSASLYQCQKLESRAGNQVVKFTRGKLCGEVKCEENCGCSYNNKTYQLGDTFRSGCQFCTCTLAGNVECTCTVIHRRKEIRDFTRDELEKYQNAIKALNKMEFPSKWFHYAKTYADYKAQAVGNAGSLPWHRYFLRLIERQLQEIDCSITIPYYDWTLNAGNQEKASIWAANVIGGDGSDINTCVKHHPFKDYFPPYWVPCLRRQFNTSVQLPDVVDIQYALNEPTYERFRLSMELYFDIFKSWVGGHMDSEYSPYDPLFLSVAAFVDRIWWDWQNKYEDGHYRYPQELRYVPMMPFKSTPDDVMNSKKDMCVTYFPLSEGAACNVTLPKLGYNSMGYDRHGFDRQGFDIEGYNRFGVDKDGNLDERGIFNIHGFDREGFKRTGFDKTGWDRFGFYIDNYNVDGYDPSGYDRRGYDRYGFDRSGVTPFGSARNSSQFINTLPDVYDAYGYNRYGINAYGFDREGYDIFGFDSTGYDRRRCNKFFLGPMLVIIKRWAELELEKVNNGTMRIITRICPQINDRPAWRYTLNWLQRGDQVPLIEGIVGRAQARARELEAQTNGLQGGIWLPVGPDKSLCFVTYYYTECPFGQFPLDCADDLCLDRQCPGFPDAVCRINRCGDCSYEWYNGITGAIIECSGCVDRDGIQRGEATNWAASDCETCTCQEGKISCAEIKCPIVTCTHPVKYPGQCCMQCDAGCDFKGILYQNGNVFTNPADKCSECDCVDGSVTCQRIPCQDIGPCTSETILDGECCPTCLDCGNRDNGERWMETPCQACTCMDGSVQCERIQCIPPDCSHPRVPPGECCSTCDGCTVNGRNLDNGGSYMPDKCTECLCRDGNLICDPVPCPMAACVNPITPPGQCCPICDLQCEFNGRIYTHGQSFISNEDQCSNCTCVNGRIQCNPVTCLRMNLPCRQPITVPGDCCPTLCPKCVADGIEYQNGATWTSLNDPCERCVCEEGINSCTRINQCPAECDHGIYRQGECCSDCTDCLFAGLQVRDRQTFVQPGDNCQQCTCSRGQVTCQYLGPCPRLPCRVTETLPGACCPQCKTCEFEGRSFTHGDKVSMDRCSTCYCREGEIECERVPCPAVPCRYPKEVAGQCCPVCLQCEHKGGVYDDGQRFTPLREPCLDCICRAGEVACETREGDCPLARCTHPIRSTKQCCPICNGCLYLRKRFRNGQKFVPPGRDNCQVCRCTEGSVTCMNMGCPAVNCDNPVLVKGQCCPVCPMGCSVMGIQYRDGQTFIDFMDRCKVCTCMMGQIRCMNMMSCAPVTCTHPAMRPGNCCPSCTMCDWNNAQYRNQEVFTNPANLCEECTCTYGSITCRSKALSCAKPKCLDPVMDMTTCCPTCSSQQCSYAGRQYREGQVVPASRDVCETCTCEQGAIECKDTQCPPISCRHPGRDQCCQTCSYCSFSGMQFELGEMFPSKDNPCEDCVCQAGTVRCNQRLCDVPNCQNPVYPPGGCCPECSDCTYQGILYKDGENFSNPARPCEYCHCMKGSVACDRRLCPEVSCQYPASDGCCPVCQDCHYDNMRHKNGAVFASNDGCGQCQCVDGNVRCEPRNCPPVSCDHPVTNGCCPKCEDCSHQGVDRANGETFTNGENPCETCSCLNGVVTCSRQQCPRVTCPMATQGRCCLECPEVLELECFYENNVYRNGESFPSATQRCSDCVCNGGRVECSRRQCPPTFCQHPIQTGCCYECGNCDYGNRVYTDGQRFTDGCEDCICSGGSVQCREKRCAPVSCASPVTVDCCPICGDCQYENRVLQNGDVFPHARDPCQQCVCQGGSVVCEQRQCGPITCRHPVQGKCCPECDDCQLGTRRITNGSEYPDTNDACSTCMCKAGTITCMRPDCAPVTCTDPGEDACGCPVCDQGCIYHRTTVSDGQRFEDPTNRCKECICRAGFVQCFKKGCRTNCTHAADSDGCCPICTSCLYEGQIQIDGTDFTSAVNPCEQCTCQGGNVICTHIDCPRVNCDNPVAQPGQCCATCAVCRLNGREYVDAESFRHPSDPCKICICIAGRVECEPESCQLRCANPVPGRCCPSCEQCLYQGTIHDNGATFSLDACTQCTCRDGSVTCAKQSCPTLTCLQKITNPGQCCPVCEGCMVNGQLMTDGSEWKQRGNPCVTCTCTGGVVTCMQMKCLAPCASPVTVPGQCCPVCPTCRHNKREFRDGESFSPSGDPCDTCICEAGQLQCHHNTCPGIKTCPFAQQRAPAPGTCCPTCAGLSTGCNRENFGEVRRPNPTQPCLYCVCQSNSQWECQEDVCPAVSCPNPVAPPGGCCPQCLSCFDIATNRNYQDGETWSHTNNCNTCTCKAGAIECAVTVCGAITCNVGERLVTPPGQCCPECEGRRQGGCLVDGTQRQEREEWRPDECRTCQCLMGEVSCTSQACMTFSCGPTDSLTVLPGTCCPICLPKPATCIVYGDPHYRTFDGQDFHFMGTCKYVMARDCDNEDFMVEVQHDDRGIEGVSWAQNFTITTSNVRVDILQDHNVLVNNRRVRLPINLGPELSVERVDDNILVNTKLGVKFVWDGRSYGEVTVPGSYKRKLCGLCGNFNGWPQDDLRTQTGQITNSAAVFGNSWKSTEQLSGSCSEATDTSPCLNAGYRVRQTASSTCEVLRGPKFSACHRAVSMNAYFDSCVFDLCACTNISDCLCDILATYARDCAKAGVRLEWRSRDLCPIACDTANGFTFDECGPVCDRTCDNWRTPLGEVTENCFKPCVPGCRCTADKVVHRGRCVLPQDCPGSNKR